MNIVVASDHGGFHLKEGLKAFLQEKGHSVMDVGSYDDRPSDYPDFAAALAEKIMSRQASRGVLVCGSGVGACIAANKFPGIRASVCHDAFSAHQGVEDDAMNVICLGARVIGPKLAEEVVAAFVAARFSNAARHRRRLEK
ncbi:MAG TPA: ribose 5-phosphate isomerase B, partial [Thermodesulfovibrionales bacterium]|nr:ribose 5-phosphate isomerase B [Thermodesulfovibrionales bacterium]